MKSIDRTIETLRRLSPDNQRIVGELIESLGKAAGVDMAAEYKEPADNIGKWETRMTMEGKTKRTIDFYLYYAKKFLEEHPRPTRLDVQAYLAGKLEEGVTPTAVKNMQKSMVSLFKFLQEEGLWPENVTERLGSIKVPKTERYVPPLADVERVLAEGGWARKRDADKMRLLIVLLMESGLRITEAVTVEKEKLNLDARTLEVLGKGNKVRKVPLSEPIVASLRRYIEEHVSDSPYLFPGEGAELKHWQIHNCEKTLKRACARAGVRAFTPHALRHLFATTALRNGAKLEVISRILGHASVGITGDVYRHVDMAEMQQEVDRHGPMSEK
jgi:site-specific recombinase XerD